MSYRLDIDKKFSFLKLIIFSVYTFSMFCLISFFHGFLFEKYLPYVYLIACLYLIFMLSYFIFICSDLHEIKNKNVSKREAAYLFGLNPGQTASREYRSGILVGVILAYPIIFSNFFYCLNLVVGNQYSISLPVENIRLEWIKFSLYKYVSAITFDFIGIFDIKAIKIKEATFLSRLVIFFYNFLCGVLCFSIIWNISKYFYYVKNEDEKRSKNY